MHKKLVNHLLFVISAPIHEASQRSMARQFALPAPRPRQHDGYPANYRQQKPADGRPGGAITAFAIQPADGRLALVNQIPSQGGSPCYLSLYIPGLALFSRLARAGGDDGIVGVGGVATP